MSFVKKVVGPDEKLIGISSIHWFYGMQGLFWLLGLLALGIFFDSHLSAWAASPRLAPVSAPLYVISNYALWICMGIGAILFLMYFTTMISAEIGLTTKRVIYKKGLLLVDVRQIDIEEIKSADVNNGLLGRFLNYGYVALDARFVANVELPAVADPYRFTKALNELRTRQRGDTMKIVLEGASDNVRVVQSAGGEAIPMQPAHSLTDRRYRALEDDPIEAVANVVDETVQSASRTSEGVRIRPQKQKRTRGPKLAHERHAAAKVRQTQEQNNRILKGQEPIVFKQALLKREIKEDFSGQSSGHSDAA